VSGIPSSGHTTRTLILSPDESQLYVSLGSATNIDNTPIQAMIRRFNVSNFSNTPLIWTTGQILADGLRNEVALAWDPMGRLWGVENGVDNTQRSDWGGDIHNENPCEELNLFSTTTPGQFYGYPYCWSEGELPSPPGKGPKTQWVDEKFRNTAPYSDAWCQNVTNVKPPYACFDAHTAPLDMEFGNITDASGHDMSAFVAYHGSWNRDLVMLRQPPAGYRVEYITFDGQDVNRVRFLEYQGPGETGSGWIRPVGLGIRPCKWGSCLMLSSDTTGQIISVAYGIN
jgi:glucose/arabinose dehydrogenase